MADRIRTRFLILLTEKELKEARRIRNNEIAMITGVSPATIARWVKDDVTKFEAPLLLAFCQYFNCEISDLIYIDRGE